MYSQPSSTTSSANASIMRPPLCRMRETQFW
ncbi:Uncharacterised protein [Bordetella pertussis]|nr:Uncharacterised protein [Bordetella pertussis]CFO65328.1 Uncharacterised protein [Bordetella pertussis]CFP67589.1 Uncharacterised protein [Bordetella pertussis]CFU02461.1 Uncharacterised protein [Bordetella pertussis]CFU79431.1 Uncharacterised protein [Bordetella pertussis]